MRLFVFYPSLGLTRVCEINRIHYWCPVGTEKSLPEGPPFQWETRLAEFPTERWTGVQASFPTGTMGPLVGIFLEPLNTNDPFFFSYTNPKFNDRRVRYSIISFGDVTETMFTVNYARCTNQLETANIQRANIGITRSCMRWYVRKKYLTRVKTTKIPIWCARNVMVMLTYMYIFS